MFTCASVLCAERMVATNSWKGLAWWRGIAACGYRRASRLAMARARRARSAGVSAGKPAPVRAALIRDALQRCPRIPL